MGNRQIRGAACALWVLAGAAHASLTAVVAVEPTARKAAQLISAQAIEGGLGRLSAQPVSLSSSDDLADVMRATRSGGYDVFIGPAQVAASAMQRGYELIGATQGSEPFVLVARKEFADLSALKGRRIYLPQQDSIYSYMARGLLNQGGLSLHDMRAQYERYPQAGLTALQLGVSDVTVVRLSEWKEWSESHADGASALARSEPVPGGFSVVIRKDLPPELRARIAQWFQVLPPAVGLAPVRMHPDAQEYRRVSELGLFTPMQLPGATRVNAKEAQQLQARGVPLLDTRIEQEYKERHIQGALWVPYVEKSLKDVAFNAAQDDFSAFDRLGRLDPAKPLIFACNGPECWKSYKAAKAAIAKGCKSVYWLRGGLPEWVSEGLPTEAAH